MEALIRRLIAHGLILLAVALLLGGCSGSDEESAMSPEESTVGIVDLEDRVDGILAETAKRTEPTNYELTDSDGKKAEIPGRRPRAVPLPAVPSGLAPSDPDIVLPIGEVAFRLKERVLALAIMDSGDIVYTDSGGVRLVPPGRGGSPRVLMTERADVLRVDASGGRLLVQAGPETWILSGPGLEDRRKIVDPPRGTAHWSDSSDQELLYVHEQLGLDATQKTRVRLETARYLLDTGESQPTTWQPGARYARLGTIPAQGRLWGHLTKDYMISPFPAPILLLEEGTPVDYATTTDQAADTGVAGDRAGRLYWIRVRPGGEGTSRLFMKDPSVPGAPELQLSGLTVSQVAVTADGASLVYTMPAHDGGCDVYQVAVAKLPGMRPLCEAFAAGDREHMADAAATMEALRARLTPLLGGREMVRTDFGLALPDPPTEAMVTDLRDALRAELRGRHGLRPATGLEELALIDNLFDSDGGYFAEEPPLILGLSGILADALGPEATWLLEGADPSLSVDFVEPTKSDQLSYTAVCAFGIARDRISGDLRLSDTAARILGSAERPLHLVENFREATLTEITRSELRKAGLYRDDLTYGQLRKQLMADGTPGDVVRLWALRLAKEEGDTALDLHISLGLAGNNPTSPVALAELGRALKDGAATELARRVFESLAELAPLEPHHHLLLGDCLMALGENDEARAAYGMARRVDVGGIYTDQIETRENLLEESEE